MVTGQTASVIVLPHQQDRLPVVAVSPLLAMGVAVASAPATSVMMSCPGAMIFVQGSNWVETGGPQSDLEEEELAAIVGMGSQVIPIAPEQPTSDVEMVVEVDPVMSQPV